MVLYYLILNEHTTIMNPNNPDRLKKDSNESRTLFPRIIMPGVIESLKSFPVTLITGARQTGKSTLAMQIFENYVTFDDINAYNSSKSDPVSFIKNLKKPVVLDEIQKVPEILNTIKYDVDSNKTPGRFLLTGSSDIISFKNIADTLAGRIGIFELFPLTAKEIAYKKENIADILFKSGIENFVVPKINQTSIFTQIIKGGYPGVQRLDSEKIRRIWFSSYVMTYIERDVRDIGELRHIDKFIRMLNMIAPLSANLFNKSELSKDAGIDNKTLDNYIYLLQKVYQIYILTPFSKNINKRFVKMPKIYMTDSGILSYMLGINSVEDFINSRYNGAILETFVFSELLKGIKYLNYPSGLYFYRTHDKEEIDFILQKDGQIIAIEVKMSQTVSEKDFKHIIGLKENIENFKSGFVLYAGDKILPFGKNIYAIPVSILF